MENIVLFDQEDAWHIYNLKIIKNEVIFFINKCGMMTKLLHTNTSNII